MGFYARFSSFNHDSSKNNKGNEQEKSKQSKDDFTIEQNFYQANKEQNGVRKEAVGVVPPSISNGREGPHRTRTNQGVSGRKNEHETPKMYRNEIVPWMNDSTVRRLDRDGLSLSRDFYASRNNSSYSGSCSSSCSGEDRYDDGSLDDWETMVDALRAENNQESSGLEHNVSEREASRMNYQYQRTSCAWSANDVNRPRSLPCIPQGRVYSWGRVVPQQLPSCPICCEDFDLTDSSFHPCPCGFQLCLFCHKTILEVDGRCPGCRKQYDSVNAGAHCEQKTRSCSKNT